MATIRMARLLKLLGHHVILYGSEENEAPCDEFVSVVTKEEQRTILKDIPYQYAGFHNQAYPIWALANSRAVEQIGKRKQPKDFVLIIGGTSQQPVAEGLPDLMTVEYSIGYISCFSKYRVYESHVWRHHITGAQDSWDGRFFDDVIPLFFDPAEHPFNPTPEPFALYVGRLTEKKGIEIACHAAKLAGIPLKVIGHGDTNLIRHGAGYVGAVSMEERDKWMARASVLIAPTTYCEPFGSTVVEAQMSGTPCVTTNFGAFVETVEQGKTGYRCNYMGEFIQGIQKAPKLDRKYIHERAVRLYSIEACAPLYQAYFERLLLLYDKTGWYSEKIPQFIPYTQPPRSSQP
jgi:glycosyltransferase involved in cell wall biosynthesis